MIEAGYSVIIDATFLQAARREQFRQLSSALAVPFVLLHFEADRDTLCARIQSRQAAGEDPSEAGINVLEAQLAAQEPLMADEMADVISVKLPMDVSTDMTGQLVEKIREMLASRHTGAEDVLDS